MLLSPDARETVEQDAQTVEVVEMGVRYIDGLQVAVVQSNPVARASASATVLIASTSTASYSPKIKVDVVGSKPSASPKGFGPLADHWFSRGGKNVHTFNATGPGLFQSICAIHLVLPSMSERVTVLKPSLTVLRCSVRPRSIEPSGSRM